MNFKAKNLMKKVIIVSAITIFILMIILSFNNISEIWDVIIKADINYILIACGLLLLYIIFTPLPLYLLTKAKKCKISFMDTFLIGNTEHFFNGITPFATGGQPFQVYAFNEAKVKASDSTGILLMNFFIYQVVLNVFCAIAFGCFFNRMNTQVDNLKWLIIVGFSMNFIILVFFLLLSTMKSFRTALTKFLLLLCKIKVVGKFLSPKIPSLEKYFTDAQLAFKELLKHIWTFIFCVILRTITLFIFYALPYFILKALSVPVQIGDFLFTVAMTSFALTMVVWLPTPGASGGIELAFKSLFATIAGVTSAVAFGGMLIWRFLTYYLLMVLSFFMFLIFENKYKKVYALENEEKLKNEAKEETASSDNEDITSKLKDKLDFNDDKEVADLEKSEEIVMEIRAKLDAQIPSDEDKKE